MLAGKPGASRAVVRALHELERVPWWRVIKSDGTIAEVLAEQAPKLKAEGVVVERRVQPPAPVDTVGDDLGASGSPSPAATTSPGTPQRKNPKWPIAEALSARRST